MKTKEKKKCCGNSWTKPHDLCLEDIAEMTVKLQQPCTLSEIGMEEILKHVLRQSAEREKMHQLSILAILIYVHMN